MPTVNVLNLLHVLHSCASYMCFMCFICVLHVLHGRIVGLLGLVFFKQCSFVDCQISFFHALQGLVRYCAKEIQDHIRQNLAGLSQDSLFELGKVFCLPSAVMIFFLDCSPKVFYGVEGGYGRWVVVFGDLSDSFVFEKLLGCINIMGQRQIRPEVVENNCCAFPGWMEWLACRES